MAATIPGSVLVDIPNCGHMSTLERPEAVNEALRAWLNAVIQAETGKPLASGQSAGAAG